MPTAKEKREKLAIMSDVFRRVYEHKKFQSPEERHRFLDKMVAWFNRLFDAWEHETMDDFTHRLKALGITQEELSEAMAQIEARPEHMRPKRREH